MTSSPATGPDLASGEKLLESWHVSARTFAIRVGVIVLFWVAIGQIGSIGQPLTVHLGALPAAILVGLFYMWVFGELDVWFQNRRTEWHLTNRAIHIHPDDDLPARIALTDIRRINRWPFWSLVVRFTSGTATTIPVPPNPGALRSRILSARDAQIPSGGT